MVACFHSFSELGFSDKFMHELHSIIHKRFLAVRKSIRDKLKRMIPKKAATPTIKKNDNAILYTGG